jgi:wobble nucleotide-excising tRNase
MIEKFKNIGNLAVFNDFKWDESVLDNQSNIIKFNQINIIYGRNYSGKTTLSRIIRALEKGIISDKYDNPNFEISFNGSTLATQSNLMAHGKKIRVFNEDFIKEKLRFIINPDESIAPFAILGGNVSIESEIIDLNNSLGKNIEGSESGFYLELKNAIINTKTASDVYTSENNKLEQQLSDKATNRQFGIKYKSEKFGDQNYTKPKLESDITVVLKTSFTPLTDDEQKSKLKLLSEKLNQDIEEIHKPNFDLRNLKNDAENLITKPISSSDKIEQLVKDSILNRWVKEGRQLHKDKIAKCSFCGNDISEERWKELDSHFDEESEKLENEIKLFISKIETIITNLDSQLIINKDLFYSKFHSDLDRLIVLRQKIISGIKAEITRLKVNLQERKDDILNSKIFCNMKDNSQRLNWCWTIFENLRVSANSYSTLLGTEQTEAKKKLRLREVNDFVKTIRYKDEVAKILRLKSSSETEAQKKKEIEQKIQNQLKLIDDKLRLMNDEEKGALKVNEYLSNYFGHDFLTLQALEDIDKSGGKKIRFEIIRNGKKAYHLSEGECSLIAFCYFMAKLEDIETKGSKPIIWIDDPISSLDSNHIFFVYSLIKSEILSKNEFEQLFVSTHSLEFLKYLKRLCGKFIDTNGASKDYQKQYFIINRQDKYATINLMPKYLKKFITEFNYLFQQIFSCSQINTIDDTNYTLFYNFGNNARKFLELYLFYKYPDYTDDESKLEKFFGNVPVPSILTGRINNEYSHLKGSIERGELPVEVPEMKKVADLIIKRIKDLDAEQYQSFINSIT